jgi:hypothetical protein
MEEHMAESSQKPESSDQNQETDAPKEVGRLSPEQVQQALAWLEAKWGPNVPCPMHQGPTRWEVNPYFGQLPGYEATGFLSNSGRSFPAVIVTCTICAFMVPVNAIRAGIIPPDPPEVHEAAGEAE